VAVDADGSVMGKIRTEIFLVEDDARLASFVESHAPRRRAEPSDVVAHVVAATER
jgi:hypothetical protein